MGEGVCGGSGFNKGGQLGSWPGCGCVTLCMFDGGRGEVGGM